MRILVSITIVLVAFLFNSCAQSQQGKFLLTPKEFSEKLKSNPSAVLVDVRSSEEFENGHLINALNYNWNDEAFDQQIAKLDSSKPVYVYCMSGGRSSSAANSIRKRGFKNVFELDGGIMQWRAAQLPETSSNAIQSLGMTMQDFKKIISVDKTVLVDFYAEWCAPCKKMKPFLDEISNEMKDKVQVVRINVDQNKNLCTDLHIDKLPILQVYRNNNLIWNHFGYIEKAEIKEQLL
jgi:thioredoxin 1